ncbi:MAG: hypothetical protein U5K79_12015 [Cyclobacteriaceae bacterium]|nr:hypothetical protein [Cyclobacteriaceae bacterium]
MPGQHKFHDFRSEWPRARGENHHQQRCLASSDSSQIRGSKAEHLFANRKLAFDYLDPSWGLHAPDFKSKFLRLLVSISHQEEDTLVGKFVSFTYGAGFPALWLLENLDRKTMDWIQYEFAKVPMSFFRQIKKGVNAHALVPADYERDNGNSYAHSAPKTDARIILFGGKRNLCFLPDSQQKTFEFLESFKPGYHKLYLPENYSHLDVFLGKSAHKDIFPIMIRELNQN